jgi:hypothetical protein
VVRLQYPADAIVEATDVAFSKPVVWDVIKQTLQVVGWGQSLFDQTVLDHAVAYVFEHSNHGFEPLFRRLVLRNAVIKMLFGKVLDPRAIRKKETYPFGIALT